MYFIQKHIFTMETTTVNQRVEQIVFEHLKLKNPAVFDKMLGVTRNTTYNIIKGIGNRISKPSTEYLQKVCEAVPEIDANWLLIGLGEREKPDKDIIRKEHERLNELAIENQTMKQENQSLKFALALAAKHSNFQQGNTAANFKFVSSKKPVNQRVGIIIQFVADSTTDSRYSTSVIA